MGVKVGSRRRGPGGGAFFAAFPDDAHQVRKRPERIEKHNPAHQGSDECVESVFSAQHVVYIIARESVHLHLLDLVLELGAPLRTISCSLDHTVVVQNDCVHRLLDLWDLLVRSLQHSSGRVRQVHESLCIRDRRIYQFTISIGELIIR